MSRPLLLSVRPRFARALLGGTKTVEVRRRFPALEAGTTVVIYASSPEKAVLGTMRVERVAQIPASDLWARHSGSIGIGEAELDAYLEGASVSSTIQLVEPQTWSRSVPLDQMRESLGLEPSQSFRYLDPAQLSALLALAGE